MSASVKIARIWLFPFKSLDGHPVSSARFTERGGLAGDRRWALVDDNGHFVNGKREAKVHSIRATFSPELDAIHLEWRAPSGVAGSPESFSLVDDPPRLASWFSDHLGQCITIIRQDDGGFPDDGNAPGPTLISQATLDAAEKGLGGLSHIEARFRTNIVVDGCQAFFEDALFARAGQAPVFQLGAARLGATKPCQRCVVPSRDPQNGARVEGFANAFVSWRRKTLPGDVDQSRFDHFYRLAINTTAVGQNGVEIRLGDLLTPP